MNKNHIKRNTSMMLEKLRFSIVIMTYNKPEYLLSCVNSALGQEYELKDYELIVVDDGSDEYTFRALKPLINNGLIKYVKHDRNLGVSCARNTGIRVSRNRYIAFIADDYLLPKNYLKEISRRMGNEIKVMAFKVKGIENNVIARTAEVSYSSSIEMQLSDDEREGFLRKPDVSKRLIKADISASPAAVFDRSLFMKIGLFNTKLKKGEDTDMAIRLRESGIDIYYNSYICIKRHYPYKIWPMIKYSFDAAKYRALFRSIHREHNLLLPDSIKNLFRLAKDVFYLSFIKCRYSKNKLEFIKIYPFMVLSELSKFLGICVGYFLR